MVHKRRRESAVKKGAAKLLHFSVKKLNQGG